MKFGGLLISALAECKNTNIVSHDTIGATEQQVDNTYDWKQESLADARVTRNSSGCMKAPREEI